MNKVTVEIPENLMNKIQNSNYSIKDILLKALEEYFIKEELNITTTKTWELCGSLEITNPEPQFQISDSNGKIYTNYAENIDEILY
ncbi:hypothetical protein ACN4EE_12050 [Geminocystis sp. CENA526]|uniref:hypothetical protein n=1 Tax=Geminocystis sp. CENA526 TaxID=1355871 RepID=UPI003D7007C8